MLLLLSQSLFAQQPEWFTKIRSIGLLKNNRQDIIKLFGRTEDSKQHYYFDSYDLKEGEMDVEYSRGLCGEDNKIGWNVPEFTVTRIFFFPKQPVTPKQLKLKLKNFRKKEVFDSPRNFHYESDDVGIYFNVNRNGKISSLEFRPTGKFDSLFCSQQV